VRARWWQANINAVLQRATGTSMQEIESLITELQTLRDTLQSEAARVQPHLKSRRSVVIRKGYGVPPDFSMHSRAYPKRTLDL
jgi:hypothetical protein